MVHATEVTAVHVKAISHFRQRVKGIKCSTTVAIYLPPSENPCVGATAINLR